MVVTCEHCLGQASAPLLINLATKDASNERVPSQSSPIGEERLEIPQAVLGCLGRSYHEWRYNIHCSSYLRRMAHHQGRIFPGSGSRCAL